MKDELRNPDNVGGLRYTDHNVMNGALCEFATRWRIDGDYIRCGTCDRPQLTSYADNDFPHADFCRVKDSPNIERRPWQTYVALLSPLCRASPAGGDDSAEGPLALNFVNPLDAPAGSGEVERLVQKFRDEAAKCRGIETYGGVCEANGFDRSANMLEALLRKLKQGAEHG